MWFLEVVLTAVADVEDVGDAEGWDHGWITRVVIVTKVESGWKDLIWVAMSGPPGAKKIAN